MKAAAAGGRARAVGRIGAALLAVAVLGTAPRAPAQDFAEPGPPGPGTFVEDGLPPATGGVSFAATSIRWFGLPELETRSVVCTAGWRGLRLAAGLSQTGEPAIGWNAVGLACGVAHADGGAGLRAVARQDRALEPGSAAAARLEAHAGAEVGWGAWLRAGPEWTIWAAVPQSWTVGVAPPLERPLEIGVRLERHGLACWLVRAAPAGGTASDHAAGLALCSGSLRAWAGARDRPLRGDVGLAVRARRLRLAAAVECHPDLGETVLLTLGIEGAAP